MNLAKWALLRTHANDAIWAAPSFETGATEQPTANYGDYSSEDDFFFFTTVTLLTGCTSLVVGLVK